MSTSTRRTSRSGAGSAEPDLKAVSALFAGDLITPRDRRYERARTTWNAGIERFPAVVARCVDPHDVAVAIRAARELELPLAVRGGGHSAAGHSSCDGGIVIDLSPLKQVSVDPERRIVRAGAGLLLGELDRETQRFGLAVPAGTVSHTGVAGLTLGGGLGWLMRRYGLTVDNLLGAEVVTADGRILDVSEQEHPDLLWALRGGGGNFGVVTSFTFQAHPVGPIVTGGMLAFPIERTHEVLSASRALVAEAPDELTVFGVLITAPPHEPFPPQLQGRPVVIVALCHVGGEQAAAADVAPLRALGPALDLVGPMPFMALQAMIDDTAPPGRGNHSGGLQLPDLSEQVVSVLVERFAQATSPFAHVILPSLGGAVARVPADATAFPHRAAPYMAWIVTEWLLEDAERASDHRAWVRATRDALSGLGSGVYVNALSDDPQLIGQAYGVNLPRLRELKRRFDPDNVFRLNANIEPAAAAA
jgi:FAD/FMN-containing dehydrogenase